MKNDSVKTSQKNCKTVGEYFLMKKIPFDTNDQVTPQTR